VTINFYGGALIKVLVVHQHCLSLYCTRLLLLLPHSLWRYNLCSIKKKLFSDFLNYIFKWKIKDTLENQASISKEDFRVVSFVISMINFNQYFQNGIFRKVNATSNYFWAKQNHEKFEISVKTNNFCSKEN